MSTADYRPTWPVQGPPEPRGLAAHEALSNAHGVTRELAVLTAATPVHIPGNLLSHDQQRGISGWVAHHGSLASVEGGADGGGSLRMHGGATTQHSAYLSPPLAVTAETLYTLSCRLECVSGAPATTGQLFIQWFDSSAVLISTSNSGAWIADAGTAITASFPATSPAGAVTATPVIYGDAAAVAGRDVRISAICFRTSSAIPDSSGVAGVSGAGGVALRVGALGQLEITLSSSAGFVIFPSPAGFATASAAGGIANVWASRSAGTGVLYCLGDPAYVIPPAQSLGTAQGGGARVLAVSAIAPNHLNTPVVELQGLANGDVVSMTPIRYEVFA